MNGAKCVVTGGARGIGNAICAAFIAEGAQVLLTDIDHVSGAEAARELGCDFMPLDVRSEADWEALAQRLPVADVVVNNAGITGFEEAVRPHDPENAALEDWRAVHAVNTDGTFLGCRYALRATRAAGAGSIINITSRSGRVGIPGAAA
jgi:NAD(P)-dependent dehydrogenase (short-subunit alcohol dehydrogenase family)